MQRSNVQTILVTGCAGFYGRAKPGTLLKHFGARPEAIKLAPVIRKLQRRCLEQGSRNPESFLRQDKLREGTGTRERERGSKGTGGGSVVTAIANKESKQPRCAALLA